MHTFLMNFHGELVIEAYTEEDAKAKGIDRVEGANIDILDIQGVYTIDHRIDALG